MPSQIEWEFQPKSRQPAHPFGMQWLIIGAIVSLSTVVGEVSTPAQAASLTNWNFDPAANQLEITVKDGTTPRYFLMAQPARIVVDLPGTAIGNVSAQKTYAGAVRQIRVSQFEPGLTRIVMEISPGVSLAPGQVKLQKVSDRSTQAGSRWLLSPLITPPSANVVTPQPSSVQPRPASSIATVPTPAIAPAPAPLDTSPLQPATDLPPPPAGKPSTPASVAADVDQRLTANSQQSSTPSTTTSVAVNGGKPTTTTAPTPIALAPVLPSSPAPTPIALAPVLPSSPAQNTETTPLPPMLVNPIDPNMVLDTSSGVAIAVPSPTPSTKVTPPAAIVATADSMPRSASRVASPRIVSRAQTPKTGNTDRLPATAPVAIVSTDRRSQPATVQSPTVTPDLAAEVPVTLAVQPSVAPSVSVPPLNAPLNARRGDRVQNDRAVSGSRSNLPVRSRQSEAELPASPTSNSQPDIIAPSLQVGTPNLGSSGNAQLGFAAASPDTAAIASVSVPPLQTLPPLQTTAPSTSLPGATASYDANSIRHPGATSLAGTSYDASTVRQPFSTSNLAPPLQAPLQSSARPSATPTYDANTVRQVPTRLVSSSIVNFGQPLPVTSGAVNVSGQPLASVNQTPGVRQALQPTAPNVLLLAGTTLSLLYPGNSALSLRTDRPQQEVLVLQTDLRDRTGNLLAPAGSLVTGRFETTTAGSQFVTQAIALTGRSLPLVAQSEALNGSRQVTNTTLARNSGIGILAGGVLGAIGGSTGLGAIGGAAAGAATTLITAPKPALIQPGQIVQVRLTQDLSSAE